MRRSARSARLEWVLVGVIAVALLVALFAVVGDGGGSGVPTHLVGGHGG